MGTDAVAPTKRKPHRRDIQIGDIYAGEDEYLIRLFANENNDERITWVDFEIIQVVGFDKADSHRFFNRKGAQSRPDPVYAPDEADAARSNHDPGDEDAQR